jgi:hypothetical protein
MVGGSTSRSRAAWWKALWCAVALVLVASACSGGDDDDDGGGDATETTIKGSADFEPGDGGESYVPTGELIADSGFRPDVNGFSFPNYGNDVGPQNLTPANVEALFGEQVCVAGTGVDCILTPAGEKWMETQNEIMAGGHCMGFSVAALRMFAGTLDPNEYGAEVPNELPLEGNVDLQAQIAQSFVYQMIPSINDERTIGSPNEILEALVGYLNDGEEQYTLGFFNADGTGGHAVTPLAVEDKGDGQYAILVYDNNYPDIVRALEIDSNENYFRYNGSSNPDIEESLYEGDASTPPMDLTPTLIGEGEQPCPFCDGELVEEGESKGSVLPAEDQYAEVALVGDNANHPHLILTDVEDESKQAGIIDGKLVNDIEGVEIIAQYTDDPSLGAPEPKFRLPLDKDVAITIDGTDLTDVAEGVIINYTSPGKVIEVDDITVAPGQQDTMFVSAESYTIVYETNNEEGVAPSFFAGVDDADASYTLGATVLGVAPGSLLAMAILEDEGQVLFDLSDAVAVEGVEMTSIVAISKLDDSGEHAWINEGLVVDTAGGVPEDVYLNYKTQELTPGSPIQLEVGREGGPFRTVEAAYTEG